MTELTTATEVLLADLSDDDILLIRRDGIEGPHKVKWGTLKDAVAGANLPSGGDTGDVLTKQSADDGDAAWAAPGEVSIPFSVGFGFAAELDTSEVALLYTFAEAVTFADDFAGSVGDVGTNPAATFTMDVQKNGVSVGSIEIATGGAFTFTSSGSVSFAVGDQLKVVGPSSTGTAANVSATLIGARD